MSNWVLTESRRLPFYRRGEKVFKTTLDNAVKKFISDNEGLPPDQLINRLDSIHLDKMKDDLIRMYMLVGNTFGEPVYSRLNKFLGGTFDDKWERSFLFYIERNRFPLIKTVEDTLKGRLSKLISIGQSDGLGADQIADIITSARGLSALTQAQAIRIARTEIVTASNFSTQQAALSTGLSLTKEWVATGGSRTRADHALMDLAQVDLDKPFELPDGSLMDFPGDNSYGAPANQVINCRCASGYNTD